MTITTEDFSGYVETTFDPGWGLTIGTTLLCLLINFSLPCLIRLGKLYEKSSSISERGDTDGGASDPSSSSVDRHKVSVNQEHFKRSKDDRNETGHGANGASLVKPNPETDSGLDCDLSVAESVYSAASSSVLSMITSSVLDARPRSRAGRIRRPEKEEEAEPFPGHRDSSFVNVNQTQTTSSVASASVLGRIEHDEISFNDAVDAHDGGHLNDPVLLKEDAHHPKDEVVGGFDRLLEISEWDKEMRHIWRLTKPFTIQAFLEGFFGIVNIALIGHFIGLREANAYVVVTILSELSSTLNYGFSEAIGTLGPQAEGAGNDKLVGRYLQLSIIFYTLGTIPIIALWAFAGEEAIRWLGFDDETAHIGQAYAYAFTFYGLFRGIDECLAEFLDFGGYEDYSTVVQTIMYGADTLVFVIAAFSGWKNLPQIGYCQTLVALLVTIGNFAYVKYRGWLKYYWEGLVGSWAVRDRRAVRNMMITAIPLGVSWILTYGEWEVMTVFARAMGPAEVSAWGLLGFIWETFEFITDGLVSAAEVRVAYHMGAARPDRAKKSAYKCLLLALVISAFVTSLMYLTAEYIPTWVTPDPTLQRMIFEQLPLVGVGQIAMALGTVCWAVVGAQGRHRLSTTVEFVGGWLISIPLSVLLVYAFNFNLQGPVACLVVGHCLSGTANAYILFRSDWESLSAIVVARHAEEDQQSSGSSSGEASEDEDCLVDDDPAQQASDVANQEREIDQ